MFHAAMQHVCVRSMMTRRYLATATADPTRHANSESAGHGKALQKRDGPCRPDCHRTYAHTVHSVPHNLGAYISHPWPEHRDIAASKVVAKCP